ncbi:CRISPR-associated protein Cas5 [Psychroflexus sp. MBR-150]|jgi:CRISPR-associated protein Cas5h
MEILSFKISGKMAHFRKYYANNTAFSFSIPPRTTLMGIVAAAMGWAKDSYYEDLASENIQFGIRVLTPLKKSFHRLNFLSIKSTGDMAKSWSSDFRGESGRIQTPFEIVTNSNITKGNVSYQVFIKANDDNAVVFEKIKNHLLSKEPVYNISFGTANFLAQIFDVILFKENDIEKRETQDYIELHSAVPTTLVEELKFKKEEYDSYNFVEEDMLPGDFVTNNNREVRIMNKLLFSNTHHPLRVKLNSPFFHLNKGYENLNIQFMDS